MNKLISILTDIFQTDFSKIPENENFQNLSTWDSMTYMLLIVRIEEDYNINLNEDEVVDMLTIDSIKKILKAHNIE